MIDINHVRYDWQKEKEYPSVAKKLKENNEKVNKIIDRDGSITIKWRPGVIKNVNGNKEGKQASYVRLSNAVSTEDGDVEVTYYINKQTRGNNVIHNPRTFKFTGSHTFTRDNKEMLIYMMSFTTQFQSGLVVVNDPVSDAETFAKNKKAQAELDNAFWVDDINSYIKDLAVSFGQNVENINDSVIKQNLYNLISGNIDLMGRFKTRLNTLKKLGDSNELVKQAVDSGVLVFEDDKWYCEGKELLGISNGADAYNSLADALFKDSSLKDMLVESIKKDNDNVLNRYRGSDIESLDRKTLIQICSAFGVKGATMSESKLKERVKKEFDKLT